MSEQVASGGPAAFGESAASGEPAASSSATSTGREINTAADLARRRAEGKPLTSQELKELSAKVKALEEMARLEDRIRALENRKRTSEAIENPDIRPNPLPRHTTTSGSQISQLQPSIELDSDNLSDSSNATTHRPHKRTRYTRGIKVIPSYTLKVSSSLREWGDWKRDIERVFEGDPDTYQTGAQKILKALFSHRTTSHLLAQRQ